MFKNPFSFEGRIRRLEFFISKLALYVTYIIFMLLPPMPSFLTIIIVITYLIFMLWFVFAQSTKRCHDRGNSGFYQLIPFYELWMLFGDSDYGHNEYGPNPKGEGNEIDKIGENLTTLDHLV